MTKAFLGVDLGGTNFKVGRVKNTVIEKTIKNAVNVTLSEKELLIILYKTIDSVITSNVKGIGIGVPGLVDPIAGVVYDIMNLPNWKKINLKELLQHRYQIPVFINNDANCFVLGEKFFGKGIKYKNFIGLSIGTGLGMGIIINNEIYSGVLCGAGEIGMTSYKDSIIENYASSFFFANTYKSNAEELNKLAQQGNEFALKAFSDFGLHLGEAIKNILYMYAPEAIILGGSITNAYPFFKKSIEESLHHFAFQKQIEHLKIEPSEKAGLAILGAAALCIKN